MATMSQRETPIATTTPGETPAAVGRLDAAVPPRHRREYHHGRTPAAWFGSIVALIAFVLASVGAVLGPHWPLIIAGGVLLLISIVGGAALTVAGLGQGPRP